MTKEELLEKINKILLNISDPEHAHALEDELHLELIQIFCPDWVKEEIKKLNEAEFPRWYA